MDGVRKAWRQPQREGHEVARCTMSRLMRRMGLKGTVRGKPVRTTISDPAKPCPLGRASQQLKALWPNVLRVSEFTCVGPPGPASSTSSS